MQVEVEEVDARPLGGKGSEQDPEKPDTWGMESGKAGKWVPMCSQTAASWKVGTSTAEGMAVAERTSAAGRS